MADIYTESPKSRSQCKLCNDHKDYKKPWYYKAFVKTNWFRGDDEYLGRICKNCIKAGRLEEMLTDITKGA